MLDLVQLIAFPALFRDYVKGVEALYPYYVTHYTDLSLETLINRQRCKNTDRQTLFSVLSKQYENITLFPEQQKNLMALKEENTFTVTTGHQLCLFGGPWFVAYKILAAIQYARTLQSQSQKYNIIPIFWLASEDHDVAEVQTLYTDTHKLYYHTDYQGITGNMPLQDIEITLQLLFQSINKGLYANTLKQILSQAYNSRFTLSQATRLFIQKLFGHLGILVLDAHIPELKAKFIPVAEKEVSEQITATHVQKNIKELHALGYKTYANPNPVNLFYIYQNNTREKWNSTHTINPNKPQHISPNVLLRPVYQELILPNIAYIGGPTEIAYWLQLKSTFNAFDVPFPVLVPRYFGLQLPTKYRRTIEKNQLDLVSILNTPKNNFIAKYFEKELGKNQSLIELEQQLQNFNTTLLRFAKNEKLGLEEAAMATVTRIEKQWRHFYSKIRKEKQKRENTLRQSIEALYDIVLPFNHWQERTLSYMSEYAIYGNALWENILQKPITEPYFWIWET